MNEQREALHRRAQRAEAAAQQTIEQVRREGMSLSKVLYAMQNGRLEAENESLLSALKEAREALATGLDLLEKTRAVAGSHESLQAARGYPPPASSVKLGKRLDTYIAETQAFIEDSIDSIVLGEK